jgi:diacylglycerol kinase (ATP)
MDMKQKEEIKEEVKEEFVAETKRFVNSFKYAGTGILTALKKERNMKIHFFAMFLVIIFGFVFKLEPVEWIVCIALFGGVIGAEMFNTAIETVVDLVTPYKNEKAKIAKDVAAGGVLVWAIVAAVIGLVIFVPKVFEFIC